MYKNFCKRIIDFTLALIGLVVLSSLFIIVWIWLTIANRNPKVLKGDMSLWLDAKILLLTIKKVFVREGISQAGEATMELIKGI